MITRLQRALEHVEELPPEIQEEIAEQIEAYTEALPVAPGTLAGSMPDIPDDAEDTLLRWRREVAPTLPMGEQLHWLDEE
jgi:hypothetical protein